MDNLEYVFKFWILLIFVYSLQYSFGSCVFFVIPYYDLLEFSRNTVPWDFIAVVLITPVITVVITIAFEFQLDTFLRGALKLALVTIRRNDICNVKLLSCWCSREEKCLPQSLSSEPSEQSTWRSHFQLREMQDSSLHSNSSSVQLESSSN